MRRKCGCLAYAEGCSLARSNPSCGRAAPIYTLHEGSGCTVHEGRGCDQSIGLTISDAIVHSQLWSTVTRSSPLGYFRSILKVVDNSPHNRWQQILHWETPGHRSLSLSFSRLWQIGLKTDIFRIGLKILGQQKNHMNYKCIKKHLIQLFLNMFC